MRSRREFLHTGLWLTGATALTTHASLALAGQPSTARAALHLLVLGGTGFIGPHLVRHAVARGHRVTIFTRGRRTADLPQSVTRLIGDRNGQLDALKGGRWDVVIDDSATNPEWVRMSTELLAGSVGRYLFTSSTGVYYPYLERNYDETDAPHLELSNPKDPSEVFGVNKARCEAQVARVFGDRGAIVRPTYIVGPGDTTDRFPYWPTRLARGGEVLTPGRPDDPVAFVDVRDLAEFMVRLVEDGRSGAFNAVGPRTPMVAREFYSRAQVAINPAARLVQVDDYELLASHGIESAVPWVMLRGNDLGHQSIRNAKAVDAGLTFRPVEQSLRDTLAWWPTTPETRRASPKFEIPPDAEPRCLAAWAARHKK